MELIADGLLIATAMTAGLYCLVLSRRLRQFTDSGEGIGPQIEAFDLALAETRTALNETREGVSEIRDSAKAAAAHLARETKRGGEIAQRIEQGIEQAKTTMQRLYEAGDRIEAHEERVARSAAPDSAADATIRISVPADEEAAESERPDEAGGLGGDSAELQEKAASALPAGPQVALPEGELVLPGDHPPTSPGEQSDDLPAARAGAILTAERVVL